MLRCPKTPGGAKGRAPGGAQGLLGWSMLRLRPAPRHTTHSGLMISLHFWSLCPLTAPTTAPPSSRRMLISTLVGARYNLAELLDLHRAVCTLIKLQPCAQPWYFASWQDMHRLVQSEFCAQQVHAGLTARCVAAESASASTASLCWCDQTLI